jgi:hypothetical protein
LITASTVDRINYLNILLIILSRVLAYLFPFHLLLFSYAVLGPAHYLTQISWLHDRQYFAAGKYTLWALALITVAIVCFGVGSSFLLMAAICIGFAMTLPISNSQRSQLLILGIPAAMLLSHYSPMAVFVAILLPTVIHVFAFTACFMLSGALKARQHSSGYIALIVLWLCAASFFLAPVNWYIFDMCPNHPGIGFFQGTATYTISLLGINAKTSMLTQGFAFLSFIYTYHYLNWFSKTRIIEWHRIPKRRLWLILALYLMALVIYAYDYVWGFQVLLFLSCPFQK